MTVIPLKSVSFHAASDIDSSMHMRYQTGPAIKLSLLGDMVVVEREGKDSMMVPVSATKSLTLDGSPTARDVAGVMTGKVTRSKGK